MRIAVSVLAGLTALGCAGCISLAETRTGGPFGGCKVGEPRVETMLFLGMAKPGGAVSRFEFSQFIETEVVPRWKEGFTVVEGSGFWLSEERHVAEREEARILIRIHDGSPVDSAGIDAIRDAYIKAFRQEAVLRTDHQTCADF